VKFGPAFSSSAFSIHAIWSSVLHSRVFGIPRNGLPTSIHNTKLRVKRRDWLSTDRPSFAAANHVVTLTRVTNERVVMVVQFSSVHFVSFEKSDVRALLQPKTATMR